MREWFVKYDRIASYSGTAENITVPFEINGNSITEIGNSAFSPLNDRVSTKTKEARRKISSVIISEGIRSIGHEAFAGCVSLNNIVLPNSLKYIGARSFKCCTSLESINIPLGVEMCNEAFRECTKLKRFVFPDQVGITSYDYPRGTNCTPSGCFIGCSALEYVALPPKLKMIQGSTFSGCVSLRSIHIPESVIAIGAGAFSDCISLEEITIPDKVAELSYDLFTNCNNLTNVIISKSAKKICDRAFYGCAKLKYILLPDGLSEINSHAFEGSGLEEVTIPPSVTHFYSDAFFRCQSLRKIVVCGENTVIRDEFRWHPANRTQRLPDQTGFPNLGSLVIEGIPGSPAEEYAKKYGISFQCLE